MKPTQPNRPVRMRVGSNTVLLTGPGAPMVVSLFRANTNPAQTLSTTPRNFQVQQSSNGAFALYVGATLAVNANQQPGTYTGIFPLDDNASWEKNAASLRQLYKLRERVRALEQQQKNN